MEYIQSLPQPVLSLIVGMAMFILLLLIILLRLLRRKKTDEEVIQEEALERIAKALPLEKSAFLLICEETWDEIFQIRSFKEKLSKIQKIKKL